MLVWGRGREGKGSGAQRERGTGGSGRDKWGLTVHVKDSELYCKNKGKPIKHLSSVIL